MSGRVINVAPRLTYTFNGAISNTQVVILGARAFAVPEGVSGVVVVRASAGTSLPTGSSAVISVWNASITAEEPQTIFLPNGNIGAITIAAADTFPRLYTQALSGGSLGTMLQVQLVPTMSSTVGTMTLILGVDLVIRDA